MSLNVDIVGSLHGTRCLLASTDVDQYKHLAEYRRRGVYVGPERSVNSGCLLSKATVTWELEGSLEEARLEDASRMPRGCLEEAYFIRR
jgi:hypothetical protein